jgi:hypothetical protein
MFCPESYLYNGRFITVVHYGHGDVRWDYRPLVERCNLLRYEIQFSKGRYDKPFLRINRKGILNKKFKNILYIVKQNLRSLRS